MSTIKTSKTGNCTSFTEISILKMRGAISALEVSDVEEEEALVEIERVVESRRLVTAPVSAYATAAIFRHAAIPAPFRRAWKGHRLGRRAGAGESRR